MESELEQALRDHLALDGGSPDRVEAWQLVRLRTHDLIDDWGCVTDWALCELLDERCKRALDRFLGVLPVYVTDDCDRVSLLGFGLIEAASSLHGLCRLTDRGRDIRVLLSGEF